ncbi:hypothetical protein THAOC_06214 [Thalassiosira oceanica]|uniref:Uncharacterized protein n=1 Tax=Thalassiosira oceanica TaxID=159749 RepID=K0TFD3_THAOC|nr:hypothetical protein THAOC_06214 [Thalassiosira oceanica]|mmetsp:Transcript_29069/g.69231  ORF Transcript_29069/g.69231 Transcript_29069/m.69231 type:complete len:159 (-) Transcript_29069:205-681(-)|eukprot:EJK72266.1 hypothetical protein THAOC_06214 [Thalassiosira oceanica]
MSDVGEETLPNESSASRPKPKRRRTRRRPGRRRVTTATQSQRNARGEENEEGSAHRRRVVGGDQRRFPTPTSSMSPDAFRLRTVGDRRRLELMCNYVESSWESERPRELDTDLLAGRRPTNSVTESAFGTITHYLTDLDEPMMGSTNSSTSGFGAGTQ